ncbi:MAG: hypothetical protein IT324_19970 [Anaerolineae bacterium]|nr:hypothetical protein [Anaerolineae bacterium]
MPTFVAANNLTIRSDDSAWRLFNGRGDDTQPLVEAKPDGLSYGPMFAAARRLSPDGHLSPDQITMVVVGWAVEDSSWHLGLMVAQEIAQARGGRWCGLARWDDYAGGDAEQAGAALAAALHKPFRYVPPATAPTPAVEEAPAEAATEEPAPSPELRVVETPAAIPALELPPVQPMPLPIAVGEWILEEHLQGLLLRRPQAWRTRTLIYGLLSIALAIIFALLSLGAKLSIYAPVQPDWLPLVGLGIAVVMLGAGLWQLLTLARAASVLIDNRQRLVRVMRGKRQAVVQSPYEGIEYLLISHILSRREAGSSTDPLSYDRIWPEVWIHLYSPRRGFINVCYTSHTEGRMRAGLSFAERRPLNLAEIDTPAHHAAHLIAEMIGIPAYVEARG